MRIINREQFLEMPSGTVYCKYDPKWGFGDLCIKDCDPSEGWKPDWVYRQLHGDMGCLEPEEMEKALKGKFRFDLDSSARDGLYEEDQLFAVYDEYDVKQLINELIGE